jgi:soluble lytic murein transglycosylase-like protein
MQIMPFNLQGTDPYDPKQNILRGTEIIAGQLRHYKGNLNLALAAYNAGSGAVAKDLARGVKG